MFVPPGWRYFNLQLKYWAESVLNVHYDLNSLYIVLILNCVSHILISVESILYMFLVFVINFPNTFHDVQTIIIVFSVFCEQTLYVGAFIHVDVFRFDFIYFFIYDNDVLFILFLVSMIITKQLRSVSLYILTTNFLN